MNRVEDKGATVVAHHDAVVEMIVLNDEIAIGLDLRPDSPTLAAPARAGERENESGIFRPIAPQVMHLAPAEMHGPLPVPHDKHVVAGVLDLETVHVKVFRVTDQREPVAEAAVRPPLLLFYLELSRRSLQFVRGFFASRRTSRSR